MINKSPLGGVRINGVPVYETSRLKEIEYDCILVVPGNHKVEIIQQLVAMGIEKNKIIPWFTDGGHSWEKKRISFQGESLLAEMDDVKIRLQHSSDILAFEEIYLRNTYGFYCGTQPSIAVDIGMNIGLATLMLAHHPEVAHVYSYEPFADTYAQAEYNVSLNPHLQAKITMNNYGLSNKDMVQRIPYNQDFPGGMRTGEAYAGIDQDGVEIQLKDAATILKPIFEKHREKNIIMKIDCEGSEYSIFRSLESSGLLNVPQIYLMETHDGREQELLSALKRTGYGYFAPYDGRNGLGSIYAIKMNSV